jgi:hypothetical protein
LEWGATMSGVLKPAIILLFLLSEAALPPMSKLWTDTEKAEFQGCLSRMAVSAKEKTPKLDARFCEVWEEQEHWKRAHPEASKKKEIQGEFSKCNHEHAAEVNGAPEQARAALDLCWCRAYGLPDPK